jgi:CBS domain containing-hemolysin-like protein
MGTLVSIGAGVLVVLGVTVLTGYFVAQEFGFMAVDRSRLRARAAVGDVAARRALEITSRTSFMLSGAQLGITMTGLVVGYVAEPMIGEGLAELSGVAGVPAGVGVAVGTTLALLLATVVQMVFGELFPKNLAIARPEPVARRLALSTAIYLRLFGWIVTVFDAASNTLLRAMRIEPVHDVEHAATPRDLEAIIDESRDSGDLPPHLSVLLDRVLDFGDRTARAAMIPRPRVATVRVDEPLTTLVRRMGRGHSRYPVIGENVDDVVGVVCLRDVLRLGREHLPSRTAGELARPPVLVPDTLPLTEVLDQLREAGEEFACVLDEYGGLAGIVTTEDLAEELVGEITDEHDPAGAEPATQAPDDSPVDCCMAAGSMHIDEVERLVGHDLPHGHHNTLSGLVIAVLGRLPEPGDTVALDLPRPVGDDGPPARLEVTVRTVTRRVPDRLELRRVSPATHPLRDRLREGTDDGGPI